MHITGSSAAWDLRDSLELARWLNAQPWEKACGETIALRLDIQDNDCHIESLLTRHIAAHASHMPGMCVLRLEETASSLRRELAAGYELSAGHNAWDFMPQLAQCLGGQPLIALVHLAPVFTDTSFLESELQQITDAARKSSAALRLHFIFFLGPFQTIGSVRTLDLTTGEPRTELFGSSTTPKAARWAAFTHLRLAWECAGKPLSTLASDIWWRSQSAPTIGSESELEAVLNSHARHVGSTEDKSIIESVRRLLRKSTFGSEIIELARRGLLWKSHPDAAFTVAPWLARLWLQQGCSDRERSLLRNSLNCVWLSRDILFRCLAMENSVRQRHTLLSGVPTSPPSEDARKSLHIACTEASSMSAYPSGHPCQPDFNRDGWHYASLGEWDAAHPAAPAFWRDLRRLRNALAHEHYVGWRHVMEVTRLGELIGRI